jgi:hypothetical protein
VHVVHIVDIGVGRNGLDEHRQVEIGGGRFQQHVGGRAQQTDGLDADEQTHRE